MHAHVQYTLHSTNGTNSPQPPSSVMTRSYPSHFGNNPFSAVPISSLTELTHDFSSDDEEFAGHLEYQELMERCVNELLV
jgi:hypothetical protein